ncbi:hypothetical protein M1843_05985 [Isoptericola sp. 4D.3]|uniref:Non-specific serine/threonine protein kinase n=1 Tax=Isoptericola peretonis TaxID=2918523 RepID=A0ABT0J1C0_9MICO|nr:hypothetical protein [Isoptericola sp. 4D.3]
MPTQSLPIPVDAGAREALLERVRALADLRHPCLEPVAALDVRDDGTLAVRRGGAATDLPTVLAVRGRLTSHEAAGVLVAAARGLAALHSEGLRQGGVRAEDVVLGATGDPMLRPRLTLDASGVGRPENADEDADDVHALATLVTELLGDRSDDDATALRAVLAAAAAPDPRVRPEAGTLAAQADAAVTPEPVRLPEPAALAAAALGRRATTRAVAAASAVAPPRRRAVRRPGAGQEAPAISKGTRAARRAAVRHGSPRPLSDRRGPARRAPAPRGAGRRAGMLRRWRPVLGVAGALGLVAVLTAVAVQVRLPDEPREAPPATIAPPAVVEAAPDAVTDPTQDRADPAGAAAELTHRRIALLSGGAAPGDGAGAADGLAGVDVPGSPAHRADAALLDDVAQAGTHVRGAEAHVEGVRTESRDGEEARVVVRYVVGAHEQEAADGAVVVPESAVRSATLRMEWTADGWRVAEVD